jgi:hypothetical protein
MEVAPGSLYFKIDCGLLLTANGTEIVRYFGRELRVVVPKEVQIIGKSCFEGCNRLKRILFEEGSKLRRIDRAALSHCDSLRSIAIPESVKVVEEAAFKDCAELESCSISDSATLETIKQQAFSGCLSLMSFYIPRTVQTIGENCFTKCRGMESFVIAENAALGQIERGTFSECDSLRSFSIPKSVEAISEDCFKKCCSLHRLKFFSGESLKKLIGDFMLADALENFGFDDKSNLLRIEIDDGGAHSDFPGWSSFADENLHLILVQNIP